MFRILTVLLVVAAVVLVSASKKWLPGQPVLIAPPNRHGRWPLLESLVALAMWASFITLAFTGFLGATMWGRSLAGYWTLTHVTFGALFAVSLAVLIVFRGEAYSFGKTPASDRFSIVQKVCFWLIVVCGLLLMLSILTAMLRVLGTEEQRLAVEVHRYSALLALLAAIVYTGTARLRQ
jgi:hypothetical protein